MRTKKTMEYESNGDINCNWGAYYQRFVRGTGGPGNKRTSGDHPNYNIIKMDQNTEKSPGDLGRLAVTQTPGKDHQLSLMWKTSKREK